MPTAVNGRAILHWDSQGQGEPILLLIGHRFRRHMWYPVLPALTANYRVLTMDNRGMGESNTPKGRWSISDMADDALAVLDAAAVDRAHIHGMSMGGFIAQELALRAPERVASLVLGCTGPFLESKPDIKIRLRDVLTRRGRIELVTHMLHGPAADQATVAASLKAVALNKPSPRGTRGQKRAMTSQCRTDEQVSAITAPTLILHGTADVLMPLAGAQRLHSLLPDSRLIELPGAGHYYMADARESSNEALLAFLRENPIR